MKKILVNILIVALLVCFSICPNCAVLTYASSNANGSDAQLVASEDLVEHNSWGVEAMGFDKVLEKAKATNREVIVAVIDTGVDTTHLFLEGRCVSEGVNLFDSSQPQTDEYEHGTHVSGTIVDCTKGDEGIKILPIKVLDDVGCGRDIDVKAGIIYAVEHNAKVINMSLSFKESRLLDEAVRYAVSKGVTVVCASGNSYGTVMLSSPSCVREAITVGCLQSLEYLSNFSSTGSYVDVVAPGANIKSCVPGGKWDSLSGTSMATPHIAAFAAVLLQLYPNPTPNQVQTIIKGACNDLGELGPDVKYGYGMPTFDNILGGDLSYRYKGFETKHKWNNRYDESFKYEAYKKDTGFIRCTFDDVDMGEKGVIEIYNGAGKLIGSYGGTELSGKTVEGKGRSLTIKVVSNDDKKVKGFKVQRIVEVDKNTHIAFDSGVKKINKAAGKKVKMPAAKNKTIKVIFNAAGGVSPIKTLKKKAVFKGWAKSEGATGVKYKAGKSYSVSGTFNLYAVFGGEKLGKLPVATPVSSMEGAKFLGWYTAKDGGKKITKNTVFTKNTTVYAHWAMAE